MVPLAVLFFLAGGLALFCGYGLWMLRPYGRYLQIVYSIFGLVGFPLITLISILVLVYMFNAGIRVLFSGTPAESLTPSEQASLRSLQGGNSAAWIVGIVIALLVVVAMTGIMAAIAIPNLLNAIDRGKQKRTMADMRAIAAAVEAYKAEFNNSYPSITTMGDLQQAVEPRFIRALPMRDGWGREFQIESSPTDYTIFSFGKDGIGDNCAPEETVQYNDEICLINGRFVRYPSGVPR
jgi:general secretion pathway protein G